MPYPNEHSCRFIDPELALQCRRTKRISDDKEYAVITCEFELPPHKKSNWAEQAFRYPIANWTPAQAKAHCKRHKGRFEAAKKPIEKSDLPPGKWVKKREVVRLEDGSGIFVKE